MLTLYIKDNCRHSKKVLDLLEKHNISFEKKNIQDPNVATELIRLGGKRQVPFLVNADPHTIARGITPCLVDGTVCMYESDRIVSYIQERYSKNSM